MRQILVTSSIFEVHHRDCIVAERGANLGSVCIPVHVEDTPCSSKCADERAILDRPNVEDLIEGSRREKISIGRESDCINRVGMLSQGVGTLSACDIPELDCRIE